MPLAFGEALQHACTAAARIYNLCFYALNETLMGTTIGSTQGPLWNGSVSYGLHPAHVHCNSADYVMLLARETRMLYLLACSFRPYRYTWSTRGSAGRLLVKLCIEVCVCFHRSSGSV
jgi:hypothetical protein